MWYRLIPAATFLFALIGGLIAANAQTAPDAIVGGVYQSAPPSLTDRQHAALRFDSSGRLISTVEKRRTYSAAIVGLAMAAGATDVFCISGSTSRVIILKHVVFGGTATITGVYDMLLVKRSTANTGGTSTSPTSVAHNSDDIAATATVAAYTANPTVGTLLGTMEAVKFTLAATTIQIHERERVYGLEEDQGIVLNNANESACLNFNGQTAGGNSVDIAIEWREIP